MKIMEAFYQIVAMLSGAIALLGSCLLTQKFIVKPFDVYSLVAPAAVAIGALLVFGQRISSATSQAVMSFGVSPIAAGLTSIVVLCALSGIAFAFIGAKKRS
jgi:hypothetical protein